MEPAFTPSSGSPWYTRPRNIVLLALLTIIIIAGIGFIGLTGYYSFKISQGEGSDVVPVKKGEFSKNIALTNTPTKKITSADILATISSDNPTKGKETAPVTIVMFIDFECPFSNSSHDVFNQMQKQYGNAVKVIFKHFPIDSIHPEASSAALAASCAHEQQKFWKYYDALFNEENPLGEKTYERIADDISLDLKQFGTCYQQKKYQTAIEKDLKDGIALGVQGTPTYFINEQKIEGVPTLDQWNTFILSEMKK